MLYHINGVTITEQRIFPEIYIPAENFPSMSWIQSSWGIRANIEPGNSVKDRIRHAAQSISTDCTRENIYTHLGWRQQYGEWFYIHSTGAIGKENVSVKLESSQLEKYSLPEDEEIDAKTAALASLELLKTADLEVTLPLLALVGLAPLCEPLKTGGIEPAFVLWLSGPSGSKKSSLAACFQSHFGPFASGKDLPASFRDTMNAIEKKAFVTKDSLLVVDDFHPTYSSQESKRMEQIAQQILRGYGDRVGKSRMRADTSLHKTYPPRGICLITGEDTPKAGISTTARFLEIELASDSINLDNLKECQEKNNFFSYAFKGYIEWLLPKL
ncbi:DNA primase domain protein [Mesobacillus boroniphilus JCM 21738]|uniref:DNA primase domain protein n=1 Tax=Mesobacillus boroniphilus JCM 21738 TaxID=1294265 RepID=W4RWX6_9BACI|nr:DNA primase domain protein [Mesobacillus boroniphilus JCM 21738]